MWKSAENQNEDSSLGSSFNISSRSSEKDVQNDDINK